MFNKKLLLPVIVSMATFGICSQADAWDSRVGVPVTYRVHVKMCPFTYFFGPATSRIPETGIWFVACETTYQYQAFEVFLSFWNYSTNGPNYGSLETMIVESILGEQYPGYWPEEVLLTVQYGDERPVEYFESLIQRVQ